MWQDYCTKLHELLTTGRFKFGQHFSLSSSVDRPKPVKGIVVISRELSRSNPGRHTTIKLYSRTEVDNNTSRGKLSEQAGLRNGKNTKHGEIDTLTFSIWFSIGPEFGIPGAIAVENGEKHQFFLRFVTLEMPDGQSIHFDCYSWVYPLRQTNADRVFFTNTSYLPSQTPEALRTLRQEELINLRGNGRGQRKDWERIYDYDCYNDLAEPDKGHGYVRPVLGGSMAYPYPRRGRTGRPLASDGKTEMRHSIVNLDFYVPPDERFSPNKLAEFISHSIQAIIHFVIPEVKSLLEGNPGNFESFEQMMKDLYSGEHASGVEAFIMQKIKELLPEETLRQAMNVTKEHPVKFPTPQIIAADKFSWRSDEEFAREMLAGLNPVVIKLLKAFPIVGRGGKGSSISVQHVEKNLGGLSLQEEDETLKPLVIELSLPGERRGEEVSRIFLPASLGTEAALWQLAKTHVAVNDSGYHQLISHWLHTHAAIEPFTIATRRQLSKMHPIHKLLEPHLKDTMHINSLARSILLNAGGLIEKTIFPGKFWVGLSSKIYEDWNFTEQGLPADLLKRGLAVKDPTEPAGVRLLIIDYPYAADGLEIWTAIKTWVKNFCNHFYASDSSVRSDTEIQAWWSEIRNVGHGDKRDEPWWYELDSLANLSEAVATIIWIASALHASINFGQFGYAGLPANRPTRCRKFVPIEGTTEFADFTRDPEKYFLQMLTDRFTATLGIALIEVLSGHIGDEIYIGQRSSEKWTDDEEVIRLFREFGENLRQVEHKIQERNQNPTLKNRRGPANIPYTLMYPDTSNLGIEKGITGRGIPNSVSI